MSNDDPLTQPSPADVEDSLNALYAMPGFARSDRMRAFLSYVVSESLAGRGDGIRAKTIAQDVYGRDPSRDDYRENIVRVDARRLRRLLEDCYSGGIDAPLVIRLTPGSYAPTFEPRVPADAPDASAAVPGEGRPGSLPRIAALAAGAAGAAIAVALIVAPSDDPEAVVGPTAERLALFDRSGALLQADNLCRWGRGLLFPLGDAQQQAIASDLFRLAAERAPDYPCGYAGASHSLTTQALLTPDEERKAGLLNQAAEMGARAQALAPKDGWVLSGLAWTALASGDLERATELGHLSEQLSPTDGNVLDFHGLISLLVGDYDEARRATDPERTRDTVGLGHASSNIYGVASFHAGDYDAAIAAWEDAVRLGEPVSALTLVYFTAAHQARGETAIAARYARELQEGWPSFPVSARLRGFYPHPDPPNEILALLSDAGWESPSERLHQ